MTAADRRPRLLLAGGAGGLVGRALLPALREGWAIRSVHPHPAPSEAAAGVEWIPRAITGTTDWAPLLEGVDAVVNVAWYREPGPLARFADLADGLVGLVDAARRAGVRRFVQISVPPAPESLETTLPYLTEKRRVDDAVRTSGIRSVILRPSMLYGPRDRLLTVMFRLIRRYGICSMFGDGRYHLSPLAATDLARIVAAALADGPSRTVEFGGPQRWPYRALTDRLFQAAGRTPRYVALGNSSSLALAAALERFGSTLLYRYEVEWLLSDRLGLPPYPDPLDPPLAPVERFLAELAANRTGRPAVG